MAWDVTVVNTLAESYIPVSAIPDGAVEDAAARKSSKYSSLPSSHIFQPLALETLGPNNTTGISFFSELGRRLTGVSKTRISSSESHWRSSITIRLLSWGTFSVPTK